MYKCIYQYHKINWQRSNVQFKFFLLSREVKSCLNWKKRKKEKKKKKKRKKRKKKQAQRRAATETVACKLIDPLYIDRLD